MSLKYFFYDKFFDLIKLPFSKPATTGNSGDLFFRVLTYRTTFLARVIWILLDLPKFIGRKF